MSDIEFHYEFVDIFMALRDFHTTYELPGPHRCVENYKAVAFDIIGSGSDEKIIVSSFYDKRILALSPSLEKLRIGDQLISISGSSTDIHFKYNDYKRGGANNAGTIRATLDSFSRVSGKHQILPTYYGEKYRFRRQNGTEYDIRLPWISVVDSTCWKQSRSLMVNPRPDPLFSLKSTGNITKKRKHQSIESEGEQLPVSQLSSSDSDFIESGSPIRWSIYHQESKTMGVITIDSFKVDAVEIHNFVPAIRQMLLGVLKDTDAVLFDIRSNLGGRIELVDRIPQLFGIEIKAGSFRATTNPINIGVFTGQQDKAWIAAYEQSQSGEDFTLLVPLTMNEQANLIGQVYLKPVGVFTNGKCYSACEVFAANMKDNNIATIFGEDNTTGGGGSSVAQYKFLSDKHGYYFPPVPFADEIPEGAQNFKVAWKQFVRVDGSLIEDLGVLSDLVVRPDLSDFETERKYYSQYDRIASVLFRRGVATGRDKLKFLLIPVDVNIISQLGNDVIFRIFSTGIKKILLLDEFSILLSSTQVLDTVSSSEVEIVLPSACMTLKIKRLTIQGYDSKEKLVFETFKRIRCTPQLRDYFEVDKSGNLIFDSSLKHIGVFEVIGSENTWTESNQKISLSTLSTNVESVLSYFLYFSTMNKLLRINGSYRFNRLEDYLRIGYTKDGRSEILFDITEVAPARHKNNTFDHIYLVPTGHIELFFKFKSSGGSPSGVVINNIVVF